MLKEYLGLIRTTVGLEIGNSLIKVVEIKKSKNKVTLTRLELIDVPVGLDVDRDMFIIDALHDLWREKHISRGRVISLMDSPALETVCLRIPMMPEKELRSALQIKAEASFSLPLEDCIWDYQILGEVVEKNIRKIDVLIASIPRERIKEHLNLLKKARLHPLALRPVSGAILDFAVHSGYTKGVVAKLNFGERRSNISILEDGVLQFTRDIPMGKDQIADSAQRTLGVERAVFERMMKEEGLASPKFLQAIEPSLSSIISELGRSFDYYRTRPERKRPSILVMSGEIAGITGLTEYFNSRLNIDTQVANAFTNITVESPKVSEGVEFSTIMGVNIGLALYEEGLNLLPPNLRRKEFTPKQRMFQITGIVLTAILIFASLAQAIRIGYLKTEIGVNKAGIAQMDPIVKDINNAKAQKEDVRVREEVFKNLVQARLSWSTLFRKMSEVIPEGLWLASFSYEKKGDTDIFTITGMTYTEPAATTFLLRVGQIPEIEKVDLNYVQAQELEGRKVTSFKITGYLKKPGSV
jgi:type IV pilus assembly protein PilM